MRHSFYAMSLIVAIFLLLALAQAEEGKDIRSDDTIFLYGLSTVSDNGFFTLIEVCRVMADGAYRRGAVYQQMSCYEFACALQAMERGSAAAVVMLYQRASCWAYDPCGRAFPLLQQEAICGQS